MDTSLPTVTIYTDGACHGNPGPGGWASILVCGKNEKELCGGEPETTNNRMELLAVISGLEALKRPSCVTVISDSAYVVNAFEKNWIETWQRKNWVRGGKPVPNSDLWIRLLQAREPHSVKFQWIRGHAGHPYNERCDRLAVRESLRFPPRSEKQKKGLPRIYADNAATTSVSPAVLSAMLPYFTESFSNPSSLYRTARDAKAALSEARKTIASSIGAETNEIFFTSGGTEGDNWVVKSIALSYRKMHPSGGHILVSAIEHHAVLRAAYAMSDLGFAVSEVLPDRFGILHPEDFAEQIREDTVLVCLMLANNEIGTIQPVRETAEAAHSFGIPVLCDAVAACGQLPLDVSKIGADYLVVSGHKIHGPKGIGFLYAKSGAPLSPLLDGGGQESGMRAGAENVAFAIGLAKALEGAALPQETDRLRALQTRLFDGLLSIEGTSVNGSMNPAFRLPGNVNISIPDLSAESILLLLDAAGISASAGSACNSESTEPSHVLLAIGRERDAASSSLRFTLSPDQTEEEIDTIIRETARIVRLLRTAQ